MDCHVIYFLIQRIMVITTMLLPALSIAETCPGNDMPDTVKAVYVKYKITDEKYIKLNKKWGAPSSVVGDELKELILWKNYQWNRLYGKYWSVDTIHEGKKSEDYFEKMDALIERQLQGEEVDLELGNRLTREEMNREKKHKVFEYDRIEVDTPEYSVYYNKANKHGYGVLGRRLSRSDRERLDDEAGSQVDSWIHSNFKDANNVFGFEKLSTRKSRILGHDVICENFKTSFKDFQRDYKQIETCTANIAGYEIELYKKAGETGQQHIMQAVLINTAYPVKKELFCAPEYVKLRKH